MVVMAVDGDRLDLMCWRHYGYLRGRVVEAVLEANPGLAMRQLLTAGQQIVLPDITPPSIEARSLW